MHTSADRDDTFMARFGHHARRIGMVSINATSSMVIIAFLVTEVPTWFTVFMCVGAVNAFISIPLQMRHATRPCARCEDEQPLHGDAEAVRRSTLLRGYHRAVGLVLPPWRMGVWFAVFVTLVALTAITNTKMFLLCGGIAMQAGTIALSVLTFFHGRLSPWCPWCRTGGDGDDGDDVPAPDPVRTSTNA